MKVRYSVHRKKAMVGQVEDVSPDWAARLIGAGHAKAVGDGGASRAASPARAAGVSASASPAETDAGRAGENKQG